MFSRAASPAVPSSVDINFDNGLSVSQFIISKLQYGDDAKLKGNPKGTVDSIIDFYGDKDAHWLSMLTHKERPWLKARDGIPEGDYCINIIEKEEMQDYYSGLS